jgi:hypothetical protein
MPGHKRLTPASLAIKISKHPWEHEMKHILNKTVGTILVGSAILLGAGFLLGLPFNFFM